MRLFAVTATWIWNCSCLCVIGLLVLLFFGSSFWNPGGAASAARIMKMMSRTSRTSVNGVMLISAITSLSCLADVIPMLVRLYNPTSHARCQRFNGRADRPRLRRTARDPAVGTLAAGGSGRLGRGRGRRGGRGTLLRSGGVQLGGDRRARVVEVEHLGQLVGGDDHLLVVRLDPRLEVVEETHGEDGHQEASCGGDERFGDAGRDDRGGRVALQGDVLEGADDAEHRSEQTDERRDDGDGADDREVRLER